LFFLNNLSKYILLIFSYISSVLLLFFLRLLLYWSIFHYRITEMAVLLNCPVYFCFL
jgi:hypothetical protein